MLSNENDLFIEEAYGKWTMISWFFTLKENASVSTFDIKGRVYDIKKDGIIFIN